MIHLYPLSSLLPYTFIKLPNKPSLFITNSTLQPLNSPQNDKQHHPHSKSSPLSKPNIWVNPKNPRAKHLLKKIFYTDSSVLLKLAKSLDSCDPNHQQVSQIIKGFGCNITHSDAGFVLNNMLKPDNAMIVFEYFRKNIEPVKHVVLYNVMMKLFRENRDFEKAAKLFDEMLQRMVKPDGITFSTIIRCAAFCSMHSKAVEWFEMMPSFGFEQDKNLSSAIISSYARIGNVDVALRLYDCAKKEKWNVDKGVFISLIKMYGKLRHDDGCLSVYDDMKVLGVKPNIATYITMLNAMGRGKMVWKAKAVYEEMINNGIPPNPSTYEALLHSYYGGTYEEMKEKGKDVDRVLYSMLLDMCADVGYVDEAVEISEQDRNLSSAIISSYACIGNADVVISSLTKLSKSFDSSDPNEQQVSEILKGLGENVTERDAKHILRNIPNPEIATLAIKYFQKKIEPERHVNLYNVLFKLFREIKDFEKAEKVFDEMLQRGVKPNVLTFSILIRCASICSLAHKSVELFERMPSFGCEQDKNLSLAIISSYARIGNVDVALRLYDCAKKEKWNVDKVPFRSLIKMYGYLENYDGCLSVYKDMKVLGVKPNFATYNTLLRAMGRGKMAWKAKAVYQEMKINGFSPNWETYSSLLEAYSRGRFTKEALSVYKEMKEMGMAMNKFLYTMLLDMCAHVGCVDEAVEIFEDMKNYETCKPDVFTYSSLINMYSIIGKVSEAEAMLNEMISHGLEPNIFVLTTFVHCYGKAKRTDDVVNIFNQFWQIGITPDDRLCVCLLYVMTQIPKEELTKITSCIEKANPKLGYIVAFLSEGSEAEDDGYFIKEASELLSSADDRVKKSLCSSLLDLCVSLGIQDRARDLLNLGLTLEIYNNIQSRTETQWCLNLKTLSFGAALTAFHVWIDDLSKSFESGEELPQLLGICTVRWHVRWRHKDMASVFESYLKELSAPFHTKMDGWFFTTSEDAKSWLQSRGSTETVADLNSTVLVLPTEDLFS